MFCMEIQFFKRTEMESVLDSQITFQEDIPVSVIFGPEYMRTKLYPLSQPEASNEDKIIYLFIDSH